MGAYVTEHVRAKVNKRYGTDFKKTARWGEVFETVADGIEISVHADVKRATTVTFSSDALTDKLVLGSEYFCDKDGDWNWPELYRAMVEHILEHSKKRKKSKKK